jgi:hypothetical protein
MAEIRLQGARVGALVRKLKAAGVPEHVRVGLEALVGPLRIPTPLIPSAAAASTNGDLPRPRSLRALPSAPPPQLSKNPEHVPERAPKLLGGA